MREYKTFFIKLLSFIVLLVVIDWGIGKFYKSMLDCALEKCPNGMHLEHAMTDIHSDVIVMGASEALCGYVSDILADSLEMSVYNCGKDACRFFIQEAELLAITKRYTPKLIIWSMLPDVLLNPNEIDDDMAGRLKPYCYDSDIAKMYLSVKSKYEPAKLLSKAYVYNSMLHEYVYGIFRANNDFENGGYQPKYGARESIDRVESDYSGQPDSNMINNFDKTLSKCKSLGIDVIAVVTSSYTTGDYCDKDCYKALKQVTQANDVPFIEDLYHCDELMNPEYFFDYAHLNNTGAPVFTSLLASRILGILKSDEVRSIYIEKSKNSL